MRTRQIASRLTCHHHITTCNCSAAVYFSELSKNDTSPQNPLAHRSRQCYRGRAAPNHSPRLELEYGCTKCILPRTRRIRAASKYRQSAGQHRLGCHRSATATTTKSLNIRSLMMTVCEYRVSSTFIHCALCIFLWFSLSAGFFLRALPPLGFFHIASPLALVPFVYLHRIHFHRSPPHPPFIETIIFDAIQNRGKKIALVWLCCFFFAGFASSALAFRSFSTRRARAQLSNAHISHTVAWCARQTAFYLSYRMLCLPYTHIP